MSSGSPFVKYIPGFKVKGFSVRTQNCDEFNEKRAKLPKLWHQFYSSDLASSANIVGVYSDYESDANGLYTVTAGITGDFESSSLDLVKIYPGDYLVFQGEGRDSEAIVAVWHQIWTYFAAKNPYQRNFVSDFEDYNGTNDIVIYIGIQSP